MSEFKTNRKQMSGQKTSSHNTKSGAVKPGPAMKHGDHPKKAGGHGK